MRNTDRRIHRTGSSPGAGGGLRHKPVGTLHKNASSDKSNR